ncbi:MAG: flavodoxin reductase [Winogradskyella sp.]|uniref:FAD-binding oxidoreductase n=1 Tax=Winogradskyella sp. TaxID=1883156 RepID=UPI0017A89EBC|nr:flavodoxin reductase [Winogradskyella sp.]
MSHHITLKKIELVTHNVLRLVTDKPQGYSFTPGQATELAINREGFKTKKRPFTFTSLPDDQELEFTIKMYPSHNGVTDELGTLKVGDELIIGDAWGAINYKGPGTFIAGGAGITPFIAILKDLERKDSLQQNTLLFSNKKEKDIIYKANLESWLGQDVFFVLSEEQKDNYTNGHIDKAYLADKNIDISKYVYLCGPPPMMEAVTADLYALGLPKSHLITED